MQRASLGLHRRWAPVAAGDLELKSLFPRPQLLSNAAPRPPRALCLPSFSRAALIALPAGPPKEPRFSQLQGQPRSAAAAIAAASPLARLASSPLPAVTRPPA